MQLKGRRGTSEDQREKGSSRHAIYVNLSKKLILDSDATGEECEMLVRNDRSLSQDGGDRREQ